MTRIRCDGKGRFRVPTLSPRFPGLPCRRPTVTLAVCTNPAIGWLRRPCTCAPTPAASVVIWPNSPTRRWRAGSTSSSCGTRARPARSSSARWRPATSSPRSRCSPTRPAGTARCWRSTTGPTSRAAAGADVLHLGQDDLPLTIARTSSGRDRVIGRSTHDRRPGRPPRWPSRSDYFCVGPCWPTPTKPGRAAPGLALVRAAAELHRAGGSATSGSQAVVRDRRHRRAAPARGARRGRAPRRRGARDHRGRRSAGRGGPIESDSHSSRLTSSGIRRRDFTQPRPACGESGMQRQFGHLVLGHPAQFGALPVGHGLEQLGRIGDDGRVGPVLPLAVAVTTVVRTVSCSAGSPASSWASRTAACSTVSWLSRAPPGSPQVPPWWLHGARC